MTVFRSQYTLCEHLGDGRGVLINTLTGALDEVDGETVEFVQNVKTIDAEAEGKNAPLRSSYLVERGYYVESLAAERAFAQGIANIKIDRAKRLSQPKYMFGVSLRCNLSCSYCWQVVEHNNGRQKTSIMTEEMVRDAFAYIDNEIPPNTRAAFISLFGGEPLLPTESHYALIKSIGDKALLRGHHLHVTSNGKCLEEFIPLLSEYSASIQVTIDDARYDGAELCLFRAGQKLSQLLPSLQKATEAGIGIFLRFLVSLETIDAFIQLSDTLFAAQGDEARGIQLGVAPIQDKTPSDEVVPGKLEILKELMSKLAGKSYSGQISLIDWRSLNLLRPLCDDRDELMEACFYHCEANISLTAFGNDGRLYCCYEGIGSEQYSVGHYSPQLMIDQAHMEQYRSRNAFSMEQCANCSLSPFCGGGCEVRGRKHNGAYLSPYCDGLHQETAWVLRNWDTVMGVISGRNL